MLRRLREEIYDLFNPWRRRRVVNHLFYISQQREDYSFSELWSYQVQDVLSRKVKGVWHVKFIVHRPGLLIGKGGKNIDTIQEFLKKRLETEVKIHIEESTLWRFNRYKY